MCANNYIKIKIILNNYNYIITLKTVRKTFQKTYYLLDFALSICPINWVYQYNIVY